MFRETITALLASIVSFLLCAVAYPVTVWGLSQLLFPDQAEGSLLHRRDRTVIGSSLVAQPFQAAKYFQPRPSAVDYKADATGGSNLGPNHPDLKAKVKERAEALKSAVERPAPVDLVTASGSGIDPHISLDGALYQLPRVAQARGISEKLLRDRIEQEVDRSGAIIGAPPRVNVLLLNLALDRESTTE